MAKSYKLLHAAKHIFLPASSAIGQKLTIGTSRSEDGRLRKDRLEVPAI